MAERSYRSSVSVRGDSTGDVWELRFNVDESNLGTGLTFETREGAMKVDQALREVYEAEAHLREERWGRTLASFGGEKAG